MLESIKAPLRRYPWLVAWHSKFCWKWHVFRDWKDNVLGESLREATTPYGFKFVARNHVANQAMLAGTFDPEEVAVMQKNLASAEVFIDVGANIGFYTCIALQEGKQVVAIEPQPRNLHCVYQNVLANNWSSRAEVFPVGLGERPGILVLYGASGPSASFIPQWAQYSARHRQTIPVTTLDILLGTRFVGKKLLIKIDVEGFEYSVLKGSLQVLEMTPRPAWLIEICLSEFHPSGLNPDFKSIFELFRTHGYEARIADAQGKLVQLADIDRWCANKKTDTGTINYLFTSPTPSDGAKC